MVRNFIDFVTAYWLIITAVLITVITVLSLSPLDELPSAPGSDKVHHLIAYAALSFPVSLRRPRYWWLLTLFFLAFSGLIEIIQPYVNRYGEWLDMAANSLGIVIGILIAMLFSYIFPVKFNTSDS